MCVIAIAETVRPTPEAVEKMFNANDHGAGLAWREDNPTEGGVEVHFKKNLDLDELQELAASLPLPYVMHCRISSVGGRRADLCHPFPVDTEAPMFLEGTTGGFVLFHNGHWNRWKDTALEASIRFPAKVPTGKWSDTRAIAWLASLYGLGICEMIDEKVVAFSPDRIEVFGTGWSQVDDIWVSNEFWKHQNTWRNTNRRGDTSTGMCRFGNCTASTNLDVDKRCPLHPLHPASVAASSQNPDGKTTTGAISGIDAAAGGAQPKGPFEAIKTAEKLFAEGIITAKELKKARRIFDVVAKMRDKSNRIKGMGGRPSNPLPQPN